MFPIDPGADATIGGMAATRASGTTAVRYGTMRENVLGLTVVLPDGSIIKTGGRARKSSSGYDLTRLFVGSEGTLGVITEADVAAVRPSRGGPRGGVPVRIDGGRGEHGDSDDSARHPGGAHRDHRRGATARRERVLQDRTIRWRRRCSSSSTASARASVEDQIRAVEEIAREHGAKGFKWASSLEDRNTLWQARHNAYYATVASRPGARAWTTDICVPISHLAECILETQADIKDGERRGAARRPRRRRQLPPDHHARPRRSRGVRHHLALERAAGRARAEVWRHLQRRARRRHRQAEISGGRARRGAGRDARDQARD